MTPPASPMGRLPVIDLARTLALLCMVIFHFTFDLMMFGHVPPGTVYTGFWPYFSRAIAGGFLLLSGLSLWLSQGKILRLAAFAKRFAMVAGAAALVSLATYLSMGAEYIRWGILHMVAAGTLIGLLFLRLPAPLTLLAATAAFAAPFYLRSAFFDAPQWLWLGLASDIPPMMDYEPILPWISPVLLGIALGKSLDRTGIWQKLRRPTGPVLRLLAWPGRHSLPIYLLHQPLLFGAVWAYTILLNGTTP
jgi:uncharacterized membrane protein